VCGTGSAYGKVWERMIERNYQTLPRPHQIAVDPVGLFYTWWRGDLLPVTRPPAELVVEKLDMPDSRGVCTPVDADDAQQRYERGHRLWLALLGDVVAGWGWVAAREAAIGQLGVGFTIPPGNRYLWDFATLPDYRGRGVYPALLQAVLRLETSADRFWIGHDTGNVASRRGILKAGFQELGAVFPTATNELVYVPEGLPDRTAAAAGLLGLPVTSETAHI